MRSTLLLALFAVPVFCAAVPRRAAAQRDHRDGGHARVYAHRDGRGHRDRIFIPTHRYKEPGVRHRSREHAHVHRYGGDRGRDGDRDGYRARDTYRYRDGCRARRHTGLLDLLVLVAGRRYSDSRAYRGGSRTRGRSRTGGRHIRL